MSAQPAEVAADVLVVGSGAAGAALCKRLSDRGAGVLCLEQGDWIDRARLPKPHLDWEARGRRHWAANPNVRRWSVDYLVGCRGGDPIKPLLYNAVGGSTVGFNANYWRLAPSDFRVRSLDGVAFDWPLSYEELAPYYAANEREVGVAGLAGDPCGPAREPLPLPPAPVGRTGQRLIEGLERLGWYWWPTEQAIATMPYFDRPGCENRGWCSFGCPQASLSSADVTYWPRALQNGVELRTGARVAEIELGPGGRAVGAVYTDAEGRARRARASVVVVACGGLGTPRLLLMSTSARHPNGLANGSGLVGRNLMVHVQSYALGLFSERLEAWAGTLGGSVSTRQFYETDPDRGYLRGFIMTGCHGVPPLDLALQLAPWGAGHHAAIDRHLNHEVGVYLCGEDLPDPKNRVELDWSQVDEHGLPSVTTYYTLSDNSWRMGQDMIARARQWLEAAGAESVRDFGLAPMWGWHLLGTARMGDDPERSVVNRFHRTHEVPNLFVVDASSLPTGGAVNPSATIQALALRCADHIWATRKEFGI